MQKYIDDLVETQKNKDLNDLDEENKEAKEKVVWDIYNNIADKIEVQDDAQEEENEQIKMYGKYENNF